MGERSRAGMPGGAHLHASLAEVLRAEGRPLAEVALWALLTQAAEGLQQLFSTETNHDTLDLVITPWSLLLHPRGLVVFRRGSHRTGEDISPFAAPECIHGMMTRHHGSIEKMHLYSLGMTLYWAADYQVPETQPVQLGKHLGHVLLGMCEDVPQRRASLSTVLSSCIKHGKSAGAIPTGMHVGRLARLVLGSFCQHENSAPGMYEVPPERRRQQIRERLRRHTHSVLVLSSDGENYATTSSRSNSLSLTANELAMMDGLYPLRQVSETLGDNPWTQNTHFHTLESHNNHLKSLDQALPSRVSPLSCARSPDQQSLASTAPGKSYKRMEQPQQTSYMLRASLDGDGLQRGPSWYETSTVASRPAQDDTPLTRQLTATQGIPRLNSAGTNSLVRPCTNVAMNGTLDQHQQPRRTSRAHPSKWVDAVPDFVKLASCPPIQVKVPLSLNAPKEHDEGVQRKVTVELLDGQRLLLSCHPKAKAQEVFEVVATRANLVQHSFFGFATCKGNSFHFVPPERKLYHVAPEGWRDVGNKKTKAPPLFTLHLRVKFFPDDEACLRHDLTRYQFYLQLRRDILEERLHCGSDLAVLLAALSLQADIGNLFPEVQERHYFRAEHYLPPGMLCLMAPGYIWEQVPRLHASLHGLARRDARRHFLKVAQSLPNYGVHSYQVLWERKALAATEAKLGIKPTGVTIHGLSNGTQVSELNFSWTEIKKIFCQRKQLVMLPVLHGEKHEFVMSSSEECHGLLRLCEDQHSYGLRNLCKPVSSLCHFDAGPEDAHVDVNQKWNTIPAMRGSSKLNTDSLSHDNKPSWLSSECNFVRKISLDGALSSTCGVNGNGTSSPRPQRIMMFVHLLKDPVHACGFDIVQSKDDGEVVPSIVVSFIIPGGPAHTGGHLCVGDKIILVNSVIIGGLDCTEVRKLLQATSPEILMLISRSQVAEHSTGNDPKHNIPGPRAIQSDSIPHSCKTNSVISEVSSIESEQHWSEITRGAQGMAARTSLGSDHNRNHNNYNGLHKAGSVDLYILELTKEEGNIGFTVTGGINTTVKHGGIYIKTIIAEGPAAKKGKMQTGDRLMEVDGCSLNGVTHKQAMEILSNTGKVVHLVLENRALDSSCAAAAKLHSSSSPEGLSPAAAPTHSETDDHKDYTFVTDENVFEVTLEKSVNGLGFSFMGDKEPCANSESCDVVRIKRLFTGYPAETCHKIQPGDVILRVNGIPLRGLSHQAVLSVLRGTGPIVTLKLCRPAPGILSCIDPDLMNPPGSPHLHGIHSNHIQALAVQQPTQEQHESGTTSGLKSWTTIEFMPDLESNQAQEHHTSSPHALSDVIISSSVVPSSLDISANDASVMPFPGSFEELDTQSMSSAPLLHTSVGSTDHEKQSSCSDSIEDMEELDNEEEDEAWEDVVDEMEDETNEEEFDDYAPEVEIELNLEKQPGEGLGFTVARGQEDGGCYVQAVVQGSALRNGQIRSGDRLLVVDTQDVSAMAYQQVVETLRATGQQVRLVVGRALKNLGAPLPPEDLPDIVLHLHQSGETGLLLCGGMGTPLQALHLSGVLAGSPAALDGSLIPGDRLHYIDGKSTLGMLRCEGEMMLSNSGPQVCIKATRDGKPVPFLKGNKMNSDSNDEQLTEELVNDTTSNVSTDNESLGTLSDTESLPSDMFRVHLDQPHGGSLGFSVVGGDRERPVLIKTVLPGGVAETEGRLCVGDHILEVNGRSVAGMSHDNVIDALRCSRGELQLLVQRPDRTNLAQKSGDNDTKTPAEKCPNGSDIDEQVLSTFRKVLASSDPNLASTLVEPASELSEDQDIDPRKDMASEEVSLPTISTSGSGMSEQDCWSPEDVNSSRCTVGGVLERNGAMESCDDIDWLNDDDEELSVQDERSPSPTEGPEAIPALDLECIPLAWSPPDSYFRGEELRTIIMRLQEHIEHSAPNMEFAVIKNLVVDESCDVASAPENLQRNRFQGVLPYDYNRVCLGDDEEYINASHVQLLVGSQKLVHIACQSPLSGTAAHFWQMVWEQEAPVIVMVTREAERGRNKCVRYWPSTLGQEIKFGCYRLKLKSRQRLEHFCIRLIDVTKEENGKSRHVAQLQFTSWPDLDVPLSAHPLLCFLRAVRFFCHHLKPQDTDELKPLVVHCNAGVGRTGVFICLHAFLNHFEQGLEFSVDDIVRDLIVQRKRMLYTLEQYKFCYKAVLEVLYYLAEAELREIH
uniref:tyrosine-protein phosphatase non-receptor type 13-like isoform X1 n=2 Tax=Myxine glutinosa TaxID=7769 RepID=UPI00358FDFF8